MKLIHQDVFREIKKSTGRFVSLFLIVMLGVAFYSGIRSSNPDMCLTADAFYDRYNLLDLRVMSTLGLTDEDVAVMEKIDGVEAAVGSYSIDVLCQMGDAQTAMKLMAVPNGINNIRLTDGREIMSRDECLVDENCLSMLGLSIGDTLAFTSGTKSDILDTVDQTEYTIVGTFLTPEYIALTYGSTNIGSGQLDGLVVVDRSVFTLGCYTEINILVRGAKELMCYSDEYEALIEQVSERFDAISEDRRRARLEEVLEEARREVAEAQEELDRRKQELEEGRLEYEDGLRQLNEAKEQLEDYKRQIAEGMGQIEEYKALLEEKQKELDDYRAQLEEGKRLLDAGEAEIIAGRKEIRDNEKLLADALKEIEAGKKEIADGEKEIADGEKKLADAEEELAEGEQLFSLLDEVHDLYLPVYELILQTPEASFPLIKVTYRTALVAILRVFDTMERSDLLDSRAAGLRQIFENLYINLESSKQTHAEFLDDLRNTENETQQLITKLGDEIEAGRAEIESGRKQLDDAKDALEKGREELKKGQKEYDDGLAALQEGKKKLAEGEAEFNQKKAEYESGKIEFEKGEKELRDAWEELRKQEEEIGHVKEIEEAEKEIADGEKELDEAKRKIDDGQAQIDDGQRQIDDALKEIAEMGLPDWYVLDRSYLSDYSSYQSDAERVGNVGMVFPVIFFIVAALVCLTTMTRMVDEERTQIGTLKALGYAKKTIISKYITYALLATVSGCVAGSLIGGKTIPFVILNVYKIMYPNLSEMLLPYNLEHCMVATVASLVLILTATFFACTKSLAEVPADLMRAVSPKQGRKLIIERIRPVWRKIPFTWKNALRNFIRYKKRLFMTLFGIVGSTALLLVGFGLSDALDTILYSQYGEINLYSEMVILDPAAEESDIENLIEYVRNDDRFKAQQKALMGTVNAEAEGEKEMIDAYIIVPENPDTLSEIIILQNRISGEKFTLNDSSVVITEKMSKVLGLEVGDTFTISEEKQNAKTLTVAGIAENYIYHYIYMTPTLYRELYGDAPEYNQLLIVNRDGLEIDEDEFGREFIELPGVGGVMCIKSTIDKFAESLQSMDYITLVLIVCAGALTFVVLFNLNNINISERRRELATLKVLGFYDIELSQYIYRENILITIIGVALGVVAGFFLNRFVVTTVEVDVVMFGREIFPMSYLISVLIALGFTVIVNIIVHFKLKKIDMATSLKSVD